jgi:hypothetical protein
MANAGRRQVIDRATVTPIVLAMVETRKFLGLVPGDSTFEDVVERFRVFLAGKGLRLRANGPNSSRRSRCTEALRTGD